MRSAACVYESEIRRPAYFRRGSGQAWRPEGRRNNSQSRMVVETGRDLPVFKKAAPRLEGGAERRRPRPARDGSLKAAATVTMRLPKLGWANQTDPLPTIS